MIKRIGAFFVSLFLVLGTIHITHPPQKSEALFGSWALVIKEYALDAAVNVIAKRMLQMITRDTVNWINSGFQGGPGFVTNPQRFGVEIADAAFNEFLTDDALNQLCSPFQGRIQLALRQDYINGPYYRCTIEDVVGNVQNFYDDFANGGWNAWFTMTQQRQNLPLGAYLQAENELGIRISANRRNWEKELDWGDGLLAWKECTATRREDVVDPTTGATTTISKKLTPEECPSNLVVTQTPGTVIEGQLDKVFGSGVSKLELADEINEIIGALINQFTIQLFGSAKGLFGLSGKIETDNLRNIGAVNLNDIVDPTDPEAADYCGSFRDGMLPTATLDASGGNATFTSNRRDITVQPGVNVRFSWCAANANQFGSVYTVRNDLSAGTCSQSGTDIPWIANGAFGGQNVSYSTSDLGCAYEITYAARNSAFEDILTGNTSTETAESKLIVRVGSTPAQPAPSQCTISTVTQANLSLAVTELASEVSGVVSEVPGSRISITSSNGDVTLTPVAPSAVSDAIKADLANRIGCSGTSGLIFMVFQVSDPNQLPPEMLAQLGSERPNQILVVVGD